MNRIQNGKTHNHEKPFPGCLGRMVNLFDLSAGMPGNRLLTDKPHRDGSPLSRSRSDVSGMSPIGGQIEDKAIISELRRTSSNRKSNGTPIKMLIAQEMSKEVDSKQKPPSVVAKLMGLDALPQQQLDSASQRSHSRGSSRSHSGISVGYWQEEHEVHQYPEQNDYKDVYEIWQSQENCVRNKSPQKERFNGITNEKKMALVRQNFIELKRLSTDEKLRQSKQFQDALEVISSNKDSFLKFLQEPNSMFSQHLSDLQSIPPPSETKRITVLKPAKMVDNNKFSGSGKKNEKQMNRTSQFDHVNRWDKSSPGFSTPTICKHEDSHTATRIVVLKPSPGKSHDIKAVVLPHSSAPRVLHVEDSYGEHKDDDTQESREVAKEITGQMRENLSGHRRDETLLSSVFSNGYTGDESSFNKSENEYTVENLSDSEVMSPTSRHSWDYINRLGSPYSMSSFSRTSYSPESSVCREAKKRLSERWAMMASTGSGQEQRHMRRISSTLGEMLALSDMKKSVRPEEDCCNKEQESMGSTSNLTSDLDDKEKCDTSYPRNLLRSKSLPVSTGYGARLDLEFLDPNMKKTDVTKELTKTRSMKSSLKGRVSSLFFSKSKKPIKEKSSRSRDEIEAAGRPRLFPGNDVDSSECGGEGFAVGVLPDLHGSSSKASSLDSFDMGTKQGIVPTKVGFVTKPSATGYVNENQEQPSPISVLEPPFEEDDHREPELSSNFKPELSSNFKPDENGLELPVHPLTSNLIDKSPPIGSIARTLSWDDSRAETATPLKSSVVPIGAEEERQEWFFFAQTLLSAVDLNSEVKSDTFLATWHSLESPLNPSLGDNYVDLNDKETPHEAKRRQRRSTRKLVFDCVNAALVDIAGYGSDPYQRANPCSGPRDRLQDQALTIIDSVWAQMKEWFSGEVSCVLGDGGDNNSVVVEGLVRKEVVGKDWVEHSRLELDNFQKEIEEKLLEELVQEAVEEFTGRVC